MIKHNLLLFFRNIKKHKISFAINIFGLAIGLACVLFIFIWVKDELSIDRFHKNDNQLYQVLVKYEDGTTGNFTQGLLAESLRTEIPEVQYATASSSIDELKTIGNGEKLFKSKGQYASKNYFDVFSYEILEGNKKEILTSKEEILLSENLAKKIFGTSKNVIGKQVTFQNEENFQVSGIFKDIQQNSSVQFDFVLPYELYKDKNGLITNWDFTTVKTALVLKNNADITTFNAKIKNYIDDKAENPGGISLYARKYSDGYLYGRNDNGEQSLGRNIYVRLFSIIALFILVIACINFMNLSTAKASQRLQEIGIKKVIGVQRKTLITQHITEAIATAFLSLLIALFIVLLFLPQFNDITGKQLSFNLIVTYLPQLLLITLITGIASGIYPAFFLSGFNIVSTLKGGVKNTFGELITRKGLVVFQFVISTILILSVVVIHNQIRLIQMQHLGYERDHIVYLDIEGKIADNLDTFIKEVKKTPGVINASSIGQNIIGGNLNGFVIDEWEGKDPSDRRSFQMRAVGPEMIETLGIEMVAGRSFSDDYQTDNSKIIFNEAAIAYMGLKDPIGKTISIQGTSLQILGIAKNFNFASLQEPINPLFFVLRPSWTDKIMIKMEPAGMPTALKELERVYSDFNPGFSFDYNFLDQEYLNQYQAEKRIGVLSKVFAGIAIAISCLGLLGLVIFMAEQRKKEIGIRKTLGQGKEQIALLLTSEFVKLVFIAMCIGLPIAFFINQNWLSTYAYRVNLKLGYFILSGMIAIGITIATVGIQAILAASKNPIEALREE